MTPDIKELEACAFIQDIIEKKDATPVGSGIEKQ